MSYLAHWLSSWLSVWLDLGGGATTVDSLNVDWAALGSVVLIVQVVEGSAQTLLEDDVAANGECAVLADGPAGGVDSTSLSWAIELELTVVGDVTSAALSVLENTTLEGEDQSAGATLLLSLCLGRGRDIDNLDLESAWVVWRAASWSRGVWADVLSDSLRNWVGSSQSGKRNWGDRVTHGVGILRY